MTLPTRAMGVLAFAFIGIAGPGCLDSLGHDEATVQTRVSQGLTRDEDDRIADKQPVFDPARAVTESFGYTYNSCDITLNKSAAVTKLDIVPLEGAEIDALGGKLFRGRPEAIAAITSIGGADPLPSMEVVNGALKPFNDGLYAAVELAVEDEKHALLAALQARLADELTSAPAAARPAFEDAAVLVGAALQLGGDAQPAPAGLQSRVQGRVALFSSQPGFARPIGFYTWTPALERIFARDRLLQNGDDLEPFGSFAALAFVLGQDPALLAQYQHVTATYVGLTNPYMSYTVDALIPFVPSVDALADTGAVRAAFANANPPRKLCEGTLVAFLPAARSKEGDYFDREFCDGVPPGTNLLDALIQAIQSGAVDPTPGADAGWYDYQLYSLETLLLPERGAESQHLLLTAGYKKKLVETFTSLLIENRETHVKELGGFATRAGGEPPMVDVYPLFPAEPFPTFYLRTGRAYRFLRTFLGATLGDAFLPGHARLLETGDVAGRTLADELDQRIALLYGLAFASADAVGLAREDGLLPDELREIDVEAAIATARTWLGTWTKDPDVARDPRVIVPVQSGTDGFITYWAVVGVKAISARAEFVEGHEPVVSPSPCWTGKLARHRYAMLVEETADVRLPDDQSPPTRAELRALCDAHGTKAEIVKALESR